MTAQEDAVRVRPANRDDIPAIVAAATSSISEDEVEGFGVPGSANPYKDIGRLEGAWRDPNNVGGEHVLVAEAAGRVVAYVTIEDRGDVLELVNIDVSGDRQGRGIGTRLVRFVEDRARHAGKQAVTLGTSRKADGTPWKSLPWWQSRGYRITHEEENAWTRAIGPGVREIRMRKDLEPGGRLRLRDVDEADLPALFEQQRDPVAVRMAAVTGRDLSDWDAYRAHWAEVRHDSGIVVKAILIDERLAGTVGRYTDDAFGKPEVGYWIGREYWGLGIASRALAAFLTEARERPMFGRASADNVASIRVLEKCGFRVVGRSRVFANARNAEIDEVVLQLG